MDNSYVWIPWYDEPAKYIEKLRLVSLIMKEEEPNAAMVWSPNFWPNDNIDEYDPGDEYVDWVGFSAVDAEVSPPPPCDAGTHARDSRALEMGGQASGRSRVL